MHGLHKSAVCIFVLMLTVELWTISTRPLCPCAVQFHTLCGAVSQPKGYIANHFAWTQSVAQPIAACGSSPRLVGCNEMTFLAHQKGLRCTWERGRNVGSEWGKWARDDLATCSIESQPLVPPNPNHPTASCTKESIELDNRTSPPAKRYTKKNFAI